MVHAEFTVEIPESVWVGALSRAHPGTRFRVLSAFTGEDSGYGLLEVSADSDTLDAVLDAMRASAAVRSVETVRRSADRAVVQFETTELPLLLTVQRAQVPLEFPVDLVDGRVTMELTAPRDRVSALADQFEALGIPYTLEHIYREVDGDGLLTDHQRDLLGAAIEYGYYDTPREITLTDLADAVDAAPSTVSETLHRVEGAVLKQYADENVEGVEDP